MFDQSKTVTLRGTVKDFRWTNPHVFIQLLVKNDQGNEEEWSIEMTSPEHLARDGWRPGTLKPGDKITLNIHPLHSNAKGGQYLSGTGPNGPLARQNATIGRSQVNLRRYALAAALVTALLTGSMAAIGASSELSLPDWSGEWQQVGATPSPDGGFYKSLDQVLKEMQWSPPNKPAVQAKIDKIVAEERKEMAAVRQGANPGGAVRACTFGYPAVMLDSPLMFEVLPTPKETVLIFSSREIRHVYTDGRAHPGKGDLWPTRWGDSIGHWEGQTLVIDTVAIKTRA